MNIEDRQEGQGITGNNTNVIIEGTGVHLLLVLVLLGFLAVFLKPWIRIMDLETLGAMIAVDLLNELTGIGLLMDLVLAIPIGLIGLNLLLMIKRQKIKILVIVTGLILSVYLLGIQGVLQLRQVGIGKELEYSMTITFMIARWLAIAVVVLGILLPEKRMGQAKTYFRIQKDWKDVRLNLWIRIINLILLLVLIAVPFIKLNSDWLYTSIDLASMNRYEFQLFHWNVQLGELIRWLRHIMAGTNLVLKIIPMIFTIYYLIRNRSKTDNLHLNPACIYLVIVYGILWMVIKPIDSILFLSPGFDLLIVLSAILIAGRILSDPKTFFFLGKRHRG